MAFFGREGKSENNIYLVKGLRHEEHSISLNVMVELENIGGHGKFESIYGFGKLTVNRGRFSRIIVKTARSVLQMWKNEIWFLESVIDLLCVNYYVKR